MNKQIHYIGPYRFNAMAGKHREPYWQSTVSINGQSKTVVDAAGIDETGRNVVRLLPYRADKSCPEIDKVLQDGDLLAYVQGPRVIPIPQSLDKLERTSLERIGDVLKGRATHAELGYRNDAGEAMQVSLWGRTGPIEAEDRRFFRHTCNDTISIYRVSLRGYGVDAHTELQLKSEMKRWKEMVKPVYFPFGAEMNIDPADFTTVAELRDIAAGFINHLPSDRNPPFKFKLNCVQWSTLVFSLAVCFPLSEAMLMKAGLLDAYKANWSGKLGFADAGLLGIEELPIPFYTLREIVENTLDMYLPEHKTALFEALSRMPLHQVLSLIGGADTRRVMPNAFVIENRLRGLGFLRNTKSVFEYVATAAPEEELELETK